MIKRIELFVHGLRQAILLAALCALGFGAAGQEIPRPEHPRPDRVRENWANLNGVWEFEFDDQDVGLKENWQSGGKEFSRKINVPFPFQAKLSGIGDTSIHHVMWYRRKFEVPVNLKDGRVLLHFGAVDYEAEAWINGKSVGKHSGGHVPFSFDITEFNDGENVLIVRAVDTENPEQPRGKQYWEPVPRGIFYTRTSGIWQTVWLEGVGNSYVSEFTMTPQVDASALDIEVKVVGSDTGVAVDVTDAGNAVATSVNQQRASLTILNPKLWSPENPHLYDISFKVMNSEGRIIDEVKSYFGMRKISIGGGKLLLNNQPYYQRLVLDQGYWPAGILTAPSDDALKYDVEMAKKFGFNGARKHQKVEDPRWLYWCDRLGFLVWGEMANAAAPSGYTKRSHDMFVSEWIEAVNRDYNHPSIVAWTPFNETWGLNGIKENLEVQEFVDEVYDITRAIDPFRPVCDNSGWEHVRTDIADLHDYAEKGEELVRNFRNLQNNHYIAQGRRPTFFVRGFSYAGQPIVMSEYGGIGLKTKQEEVIGSETKAWSYGSAEQDIEAYLKRYKQITEAVFSIDEFSGFCYTQLTDVEHEVNGVMTYDRRPKLEPAKLAEINQKK